MQSITFLSVIGGFYVIYTFKAEGNKEHCKLSNQILLTFRLIEFMIYIINFKIIVVTSPHGKSGLITFLLILIQAIAGSTLVNFPGVVGGVAKARGMYKYHRISGYLVLFLIWITALGGTQADWTKSKFDHLWVWLLAAGMVLVGTIGGINSNKLKVR